MTVNDCMGLYCKDASQKCYRFAQPSMFYGSSKKIVVQIQMPNDRQTSNYDITELLWRDMYLHPLP